MLFGGKAFDSGLNKFSEDLYRKHSFHSNGVISDYKKYLVENIDKFKGFTPRAFKDRAFFDIEEMLPILIPRMFNQMHGIINSREWNFSEILEEYGLRDFSFRKGNTDYETIECELKVLLEIVSCFPFKLQSYDDIKLDTANLTYTLFKHIPDQAISKFLDYPPIKENRVKRYNHDEKSLSVEKIVENTQSLGVGRVRYDGLGFYFKAYDTLESTIRETLSGFHKFGTSIMYNCSPFLCMINEKGYVKIGDYYFIETAEQSRETSNTNVHRNRHASEQERVFEIIAERYGCLNSYDDVVDIFNKRLFVVAAFHAEMRDMFIPKKYESFFHRETIKEFDVLVERLSNEDYALVKSLKKVYDEIKKRHDDMDKQGIAHTNTKFDNWSKSWKS